MKKKEPKQEMLDSLGTTLPGLLDLGYAQKGAEAEERSLWEQAMKLKNREVSLDELLEAADRLVDVLPSTRYPLLLVKLKEKDHRVVRMMIQNEIQTLNCDAGPGAPWNVNSKSKGDVIKKYYDELVDSTFEMLLKIHNVEMSEIWNTTAEEKVELGYASPISLFVKNEAHSRQKLETGRYRLIASLGMEQEIILRMLLYAANSEDIYTQQNGNGIPFQPGMGTHDAGLLALTARIRDTAGIAKQCDQNLVGSDVSAFDMNVVWEMVVAKVYLESQRLECDAEARELYKIFSLKVHMCLFNSVFITSKGRMFAQVDYRMQKSGSPDTAAGNSKIRAIVAVACGSDPRVVTTMGDDCIEGVAIGTTPEELFERYRPYFDLKEIVIHDEPNDIEFCSHLMSANGSVVRLGIEKAIYHAISKPYNKEEWDILKNHEARYAKVDWEKVEEVLCGCGWLPANVF
nr:RNA-dependent RNA polymerase [Flumine sobemo-like virus 8]